MPPNTRSSLGPTRDDDSGQRPDQHLDRIAQGVEPVRADERERGEDAEDGEERNEDYDYLAEPLHLPSEQNLVDDDGEERDDEGEK